MKGICVHKAKAEQQQEVLEWPPQVEEESVVEVAKAVADTAEAAARERLRSDIPIRHNELVKLIKLAELKLVTTRRSSKVVGQERFLRMWIFGVFVHGGKNGLTSLIRQRTHLARAIARYMVGKSSEPFATVVVTFIPHRDPNDGQYKTTISGLTSFCGVSCGRRTWEESMMITPYGDMFAKVAKHYLEGCISWQTDVPQHFREQLGMAPSHMKEIGWCALQAE